MTTNKILCIKDYNEEVSFIKFKKDNTYKITYEGDHVQIYDDKGRCYSFFGEDTVKEYFITLKELRELKLKKLNGNLVNK